MPTLQSLVPTRFHPFSAAELKLLQNAGLGTLSICGPGNDMNHPLNDPNKVEKWDEARSIRGELLSWICADRQTTLLVGPGGVQVFGAKIVGLFELVAVSVEFPFVFACCYFDQEIELQSARTRTLSFARTHLQSIFADGAVIAGAVFMRECHAAVVQFPGARIEGSSISIGGWPTLLCFAPWIDG